VQYRLLGPSGVFGVFGGGLVGGMEGRTLVVEGYIVAVESCLVGVDSCLVGVGSCTAGVDGWILGRFKLGGWAGWSGRRPVPGLLGDYVGSAGCACCVSCR